MLLSCRNDDDTLPPPCNDPTNEACPNYDPCLAKTPVSADFEILASLGWQDTFFVEYDTIIQTTRVKFVANQKHYESYSWQIGSEAERREGHEVEVKFGAPFGWLPITLYV